MVQYKISWGSGFYQLHSRIIAVRESTTNYQALMDMLVNQLEKEGWESCFIDCEDTIEEGGDYHEDEYVCAGNHGRLLLHHGELRIRELTERRMRYENRKIFKRFCRSRNKER